MTRFKRFSNLICWACRHKGPTLDVSKCRQTNQWKVPTLSLWGSNSKCCSGRSSDKGCLKSVGANRLHVYAEGFLENIVRMYPVPSSMLKYDIVEGSLVTNIHQPSHIRTHILNSQTTCSRLHARGIEMPGAHITEKYLYIHHSKLSLAQNSQHFRMHSNTFQSCTANSHLGGLEDPYKLQLRSCKTWAMANHWHASPFSSFSHSSRNFTVANCDCMWLWKSHTWRQAFAQVGSFSSKWLQIHSDTITYCRSKRRFKSTTQSDIGKPKWAHILQIIFRHRHLMLFCF